MTEGGTSTIKVQKTTATSLLGKALVDKGVRKRPTHQEEGRTLSGRSLQFVLISPFVSGQEMNLQNKTKIKILALVLTIRTGNQGSVL